MACTGHPNAKSVTPIEDDIMAVCDDIERIHLHPYPSTQRSLDPCLAAPAAAWIQALFPQQKASLGALGDGQQGHTWSSTPCVSGHDAGFPGDGQGLAAEARHEGAKPRVPLLAHGRKITAQP